MGGSDRADVGAARDRRNAPRDARPHLKRALDVFRTVFGDEHPQSIGVLGDIASLDASPSLLAEGIADAKQAVELAGRALGGDHPEVARLLCILAALEMQEGEDRADAAKRLERAVTIRRQALPASHPELADALDAYAAALCQATPPQNDRADAMEKEAKAIRAKHAEEDVAK